MSEKQYHTEMEDRSFKGYAHPEAEDVWGGIPDQVEDAPSPWEDIRNDDSLTVVEKQAKIDEIFYSLFPPKDERESYTDCKKYTIPGCPEEPDTEAVVYVYTPKNLKKKKMRTLFYIEGGALEVCLHDAMPIDEFCEKYDCIAVEPIYRSSLLGKYPAAINDIHAAYKWMVDHAEMLHINPDKVVINGASSGGHLATAAAFRLVKYGYRPRGVVVENPITDDRCLYPSARIKGFSWDGNGLRRMTMAWLGDERCAPTLPPEAFANRATVEDCIGYPPLFIHAGESDPDRDNNREFVGKVLAAGSYAEYHMWGGIDHNIHPLKKNNSAYGKRIEAVWDGNIMDCFKYDLRRPWLRGEEKEDK